MPDLKQLMRITNNVTFGHSSKRSRFGARLKRGLALMQYHRCPATASKTKPSKVAQPNNNNSSSTLLTELWEVNFKANITMLMRPVDELKEGNSC